MMKKIRSSNLSKLIFSHIDERQKLKLVKCNKSLQRKIDISLINYKLFSGKYLLYESNIKVKEFNIINNILIFEGVYLNGKRNGLGKEYYNNGKLKFEGKFLNGKRNGKGKEYYNSGALKFDGEYLNNKILIGTLYDENGYIIHEYNNINGIKKEYDYNGTLIFEGEYSNGERNGKGKEYNYNGLLKFEGNYIDGKRNGYGKEYDDNYLIFEGIYFNDKKWEGKGYNILKNFVYQLKGGRGSIKEYNKGELKFEGDYVNGERNGMGKEYNDKGELIFEGEYLNGLKNGKGKEYHDNGELCYEGDYIKGLKYGKGKEYNEKGELAFEGEFIADKRWSGKGKYYKPYDVLRYEGFYLDGKKNGFGKEYDCDGDLIYIGEFSNEEKYQIMSYLFDDLPKRAETGLVRQVFVGKYFSSGGDTTPNLMINISLENPASTVEDKCEKVIFISTNTFKSPVDGTLNKTKAYTGLVRFSPYMAAVLNDNLLTSGEYFDLNLNKSFEEINKMEVVERISYSQHLMLDDNLENDIIAHEVCTKIIEAKNTAPDFIFMAMCIDFMYRISIGDLDAANEMWEKMLVYCTYCNIKPESLEETYGESLYFLKALKESEV